MSSEQTAASEIRVQRIGSGIYVVELIGDHGFQSAADVGATLSTVLVGDSVILDLSRATFIDSTIIREIVFAATRAQRSSGRRLRVQVQAGGPIERTLKMMVIDELVTLCSSRRDALAT
jgi:anti-anti-sigma regulatory factor